MGRSLFMDSGHYMNGDNKIRIPWYRRNVSSIGELSDMSNPFSFGSNNIPRPNPNLRRAQTVRQLAPNPATQPARQPATNPAMQPNGVPNFIPEGIPLPIPGREQKRDEIKQPAKLPELPALPSFVWNNGNETEGNTNPVAESISTLLKPVIYFFAARELAGNFVKVNVTDPIYVEMSKDPVLGSVLREAEKSNYDLEALGTYFANYDWDNIDTNQMTKDLTSIVGAAGAARIIVFIIGRKVLFRI